MEELLCLILYISREDPFRLIDANYTFYHTLEEECCKDLEHVSFPEHRPVQTSNPAVGVGGVSTGPKEEDAAEDGEDEAGKEEAGDTPADSGVEDSKSQEQVKDNKEVTNGPTSEEVIERVDTPAQDDTDIILEVLENVHIADNANVGKSPGKVASLLSRQASEAKLEFLPHMKTLASPPGRSSPHHRVNKNNVFKNPNLSRCSPPVQFHVSSPDRLLPPLQPQLWPRFSARLHVQLQVPPAVGGAAHQDRLQESVRAMAEHRRKCGETRQP